MVATCMSAASAIRIIKRAWRVGGGVSAGGSRRVSSMLKVRVLATIDSSGYPPSKTGVRFQDPVFFPALGQRLQFSRRHLDESEQLAALANQDIVFRSSDPKLARKSHALQTINPALH